MLNKSIIFKFNPYIVSGYSKIIDTIIQSFINKKIDFYLLVDNIKDTKYSKYFRPITKEVLTNSIELVVSRLTTDVYNKNYLLLPNSHSLKYVFTMWESTKLECGISNLLNDVNTRVIVPNEWNKDNFLKDNINCPIYKVPLGINDNLFYYTLPKNKSSFIFGCGEGQHQQRKRILYTIECFCKAFPPDIKNVELHVKTDSRQFKLFPKYTDNRIKIFFDYIPENKMISFYENIDVFVSLSYAEGWGFMQHESMMCGRPVMSVNYGGITEFFDSNVGIDIEYTEELASDIYASTNGYWANTIEKDVIKKLKYCYNNQLLIKNKGLLSYNKVKHFTETNMITQLLNILEHDGKNS